MNKLCPLITIVLLVSGCGYSTKKEIYNPDYEPEISVFSVISTDNGDEFVIVEKTMRLNENDLNSASTIINDAQVFIKSGADNVQFRFYKRPGGSFWRDDYLSLGMYLDLNDQFRAETGRTYQLTVRVPDGRTVTGTTTIPAVPEITQPAPGAVLRKDNIKNTSIHWRDHPNATGYVLFFYLETRYGGERIGILSDQFVYEPPATLSDIDDYLLVNDVVPLSDIATIKIAALDQNLYDYASKSGLASLIGTDLRLLRNGIGAFGSYSVDSVKVRLE
jgi:hypothetical protein